MKFTFKSRTSSNIGDISQRRCCLVIQQDVCKEMQCNGKIQKAPATELYLFDEKLFGEESQNSISGGSFPRSVTSFIMCQTPSSKQGLLHTFRAAEMSVREERDGILMMPISTKPGEVVAESCWSWRRVEKLPGLGIGFIFLTVLLFQVVIAGYSMEYKNILFLVFISYVCSVQSMKK